MLHTEALKLTLTLIKNNKGARDLLMQKYFINPDETVWSDLRKLIQQGILHIKKEKRNLRSMRDRVSPVGDHCPPPLGKSSPSVLWMQDSPAAAPPSSHFCLGPSLAS